MNLDIPKIVTVFNILSKHIKKSNLIGLERTLI